MRGRELARAATAIECNDPKALEYVREHPGFGIIIGITGPPGAGKSTLVDALTSALRARGKTIAIVAVDPSSIATGGALLGDRIRMQRHHQDPGIFIRSMATRGSTGGLAQATGNVARLFRSAGFDYVIVETVGVGQDEIAIARLADVVVVVLVPGMGDDVQAIKAGILEIADVFAINKADYPGADQTAREIAQERHAPIVRTIATQMSGIDELLQAIENCAPRAKLPETGCEIDHLGIAVKSIEAALGFYSGQLGMTVSSLETITKEKVRAALLPAGESRIELLEGSAVDSVISRFIEKRGEGLHHVALRVPDLKSVIDRLAAAGARVLGAPQIGAAGHLYVFVHPASTGGVLLELIQEQE